MKTHLKNGFIFAGVIGFPLLYLFNLLIIYEQQNTMVLSAPLRIVGLLSAIVGLVLWALSMYTLGGKFGVVPHRHKRVTHGVYHYLRHPMYVGIWVAFMGLSFASQSWGGLVFTNIIMLPVLIMRAYFEEKQLE